ncbi:unnamed protein product [Schistosoma curassoni]|uniref:WH2 domain-containing protein n=1 Tax=Schistosoma curassoni TaxID=6186 RepID=A0A183K2R4_9TREM|nr:unnamed protein product [Schistosoma curassoni]
MQAFKCKDFQEKHEYLQKFSTKCQTSDPDSSVLPSPSVSSTSVKSDLSESIKLEIPTNRDITVLPVSQENTMHSNESATYQSYDALDDSRLYWRKLGITLFDKHQTACNFGASCPTTAATINYPSIPTPCDLSVAPKRSIPLSVQQALSCRPYLENISKPNTSLSVSKVSSDTNKTVKHYPSNSLIPRVIISKEYRRKHSTNSEALPQVSKSTAPISVGELKRLAYSLGPKQGPSLPPTQDQRENNIDRTRIVFHRSNSKRHCTHPSESTDN